METGIQHPGPITILFIFSAGLLTSLGPCSLSLLPVTFAYIGGTKNNGQKLKILSFCSGIILSLVILGALSGFLGKIYGQLPVFFNLSISIFAIFMGLNLLGLINFQLPDGPDLNFLKEKLPDFMAPLITGAAFGLASSPCITPVLATLLAWISKSHNPIISIIFLFTFGLGQIVPIIIVGFTTENMKRILAFRQYSQVIPTFSGIILISVGIINLMANWI